MKVNIGPYIPWYTTSRFENWYLEKRFKKHAWLVTDTEYNAFDDFVMVVCDGVQVVLNCTINKIMNLRTRTVKVKLDPYDHWNADETLAHIIVPLLKALQSDKQGAPAVDREDVPEHLRQTEADNERYRKAGDLDDKFFDRWDWVLNEMIFAFESKTVDWEDQFFSGEPKFRNETDDLGFDEWVEDDSSTFKIDFEGRKAYHDRMANGFRLFGKYYESLWS